MIPLDITDFCDQFEACKYGRQWAMENCKDMVEAWDNLPGSYAVWVATRPGLFDARVHLDVGLKVLAHAYNRLEFGPDRTEWDFDDEKRAISLLISLAEGKDVAERAIENACARLANDEQRFEAHLRKWRLATRMALSDRMQTNAWDVYWVLGDRLCNWESVAYWYREYPHPFLQEGTISRKES